MTPSLRRFYTLIIVSLFFSQVVKSSEGSKTKIKNKIPSTYTPNKPNNLTQKKESKYTPSSLTPSLTQNQEKIEKHKWHRLPSNHRLQCNISTSGDYVQDMYKGTQPNPVDKAQTVKNRHRIVHKKGNSQVTGKV